MKKITSTLIVGMFLLLFSALPAMVYFNRSFLFIPKYQQLQLTGSYTKNGHSYIAYTGYPEISSHAIIYENGVLLPGPANSDHQSIADLGIGRYSFWHDYVYFSTSDNSDPNTNGKRYEVKYPYVVSTTFAVILYVFSIAVWLVILIVKFNSIKAFLIVKFNSIKAFLIVKFNSIKALMWSTPLWLPIVILILLFVITRLPFYINYPIVAIHPDTGSYVNPILQYQKGKWPDFTLRTPGYSALIFIVTSVVDKWLFVIAMQSVIALISGILVVVSAYRMFPFCGIPVSLAISAYLSGSQVINYETSAGSDSLYVSLTMCFVGLLMLALQYKSSLYLALSSIAISFVVLVRPAGLYLLVIHLLVTLFIVFNKWKWRQVVWWLAPCYLVLASLSSYNYFSKQVFSVTAFGEANLAGATLFAWVPDESLPDYLNKSIAADLQVSLRRAGIDDKARETIRNSWDVRELYRIFSNYYNTIVHLEGWGWGRRLGNDYLSIRKHIAKASFIAIKQQPGLYAKFVWANLGLYFLSIEYKNDFYNSLESRVVYTFYAAEKPFSMLYAKEYKEARPPQAFVDYDPTSKSIKHKMTILAYPHKIIQIIDNSVFHRFAWVVLYFVMFIGSLVKMIYSRFKDVHSFTIFIISLMLIGAALLISLVEITLDRYSYATHFIYYLVVALSPMLISRNNDLKSKS